MNKEKQITVKTLTIIIFTMLLFLIQGCTLLSFLQGKEGTNKLAATPTQTPLSTPTPTLSADSNVIPFTPSSSPTSTPFQAPTIMPTPTPQMIATITPTTTPIPIKGTVNGTIKNTMNGEVINSAKISIKDTEFTTISGIGGTYILTNVPEGLYTIEATATGYAKWTEAINVTSQGVTKHIKLTPATGKITGSVSSIGNYGTLFAFATVSVVGEDISTKTDSDGHYTLINVPTGDQQITATISNNVGENLTKTVTVTVQQGMTSNMDLKPSATVDPYELNDDYTQAYPISVGQSYKSFIFTAGDVDWYKFTLDTYKSIAITVNRPPEFYFNRSDYFYATLYKESLGEVGTASQGSPYIKVLSPGTYYYIKCYSSASGYYSATNKYILNISEYYL